MVSERDLIPFGCLSEAEAHTIHYPNGDITHCFAMCFLARTWRGGTGRLGHAAIVRQAISAKNAGMPRVDAVIVRRASAEDAEPICAIYNAAIAERGSTFETEPRSAEYFKSRIEDTRFPLLVGDGVIGWAGLASYSSALDQRCGRAIGR